MDLIGKSTVPGAFICDLLPFLKHLPSGFPFQRKAKLGKEMIERMVTKPIEHVKRDIHAGEASPSLTQNLLTAVMDDMDNFEHRVKWVTGSMYGAGGETTYTTVLTFIMAMALHPDKQRLAQAELDDRIGVERLPTIEDRSNLPYVNAVIKETMRWHPALPLGIARRTARDDIYEGYFIPEGTIVMPNVWAIAFEANEKYDAQAFVPERFLDSAQPTIDPDLWAFGFGRRICPGRFLGENSVFILITTIWRAFDIKPPVKGTLRPEFGLDLVSHPKPFKCQISPRSEATAQLVRRRARSEK